MNTKFIHSIVWSERRGWFVFVVLLFLPSFISDFFFFCELESVMEHFLTV